MEVKRKNKPTIYKRVNKRNLHWEYMKVAEGETLGFHCFWVRISEGYTYGQILEIGKMTSSKFNRRKMPKPRVVQKKYNNTEKYRKDYFKHQKTL